MAEMRLELSRAAAADLDEIRSFSAERFGADRTIAYLDRIEAAFRRILDFPGAGPAHPSLRPPMRSLACQSHRIYYQVGEGRVLVVRVLHHAMDVDRQF